LIARKGWGGKKKNPKPPSTQQTINITEKPKRPSPMSDNWRKGNAQEGSEITV